MPNWEEEEIVLNTNDVGCAKIYLYFALLLIYSIIKLAKTVNKNKAGYKKCLI